MAKKIMNTKFLLLAIIFYAVLSGLLLNPDLPLEGDSPIFFTLGKSLSLGMGYKDLYFPGNPAHVQYPYVYPLLLSVFFLIFANSVVVFKCSSILFGIAALIAICIFWGDDQKNKQDFKFEENESNYSNIYFLGLLVICTNLWFLAFSISIIPEMVYLFFSILTIIVAEKYAKEPKAINKYFWALLLCLGLVFYTKTIGFALLLAVVLYLFFVVKDWRKGLLIICWEFFLLLSWFKFFWAFSRQDTVSQNYIAQLSSLASFSFIESINLFISNVRGYFYSLASLFLPVYFLGEKGFEGGRYFFLLYTAINEKIFFNLVSFPVLYKLMIYSIGALTCFGFLNRIKKMRFTEVYVSSYMLIIFSAPPIFYAYSSNRYLFALFPFLFFYFLNGILLILKIIQKYVNKKFDRLVLYVVCIFLLISNFIPAFFWTKTNIRYVLDYKYLSMDDKREYHPYWLWDYFSSANWIKNNTLPDAVIMHFCPQAFYVYSNRKTVFFNALPYNPRGTVLEEIKLSMKEKKVNYIVESSKEHEKIIMLLNDDFKDFIFVPLVKFVEGRAIYIVVNISPTVKLLNITGVYWYNKKNYDQAILKFEESLKLEPVFVAYYNLGKCYEAKGLLDSALDMYGEAVKMQPNFELASVLSLTDLYI